MRELTPEYKKNVEYYQGSNEDIIATIEKNFLPASKSVKQNNFYKQFKGRNLKDTCENVWNFVKDNVRYKADTIDEQKIKLPARLLADAEGDCKSMALACASIMSNLIDTNKGENVGFRYTSYRNNPTPTHVYCIVNDGQYILDCVWHSFNKQKDYKYKYDKIMKISTLSGINGTGSKYKFNIPTPQKVDKYTYDVIKHTKKALKSVKPDSEQYVALMSILNTIGDSANLKNPSISGTGTKNSLKSALLKVKTNATKIYKDAKSDIVDKPEWASKEDYAKHLAKKAIPLFIEMRNAFLALLAINFRDYANRILEHEKKQPNSIKRMWYSGFGGDYKAILAAAEKGKSKKALFGKPKVEISEPVTLTTISAFIATATPVIIALTKLLPKNAKDNETLIDATAGDLDNIKDAEVTNYGKEGELDGQVEEVKSGFKLTPTLAIGGIALIGIGIYLFKNKSKN